jgi:hypothetical protein
MNSDPSKKYFGLANEISTSTNEFQVLVITLNLSKSHLTSTNNIQPLHMELKD